MVLIVTALIYFPLHKAMAFVLRKLVKMDMSQITPSSALLTVVLLGLAPFAAVMVTSFTKIIVVLSLVSNALGLQQVPPNMVLNGLAIILSAYIMYPTSQQVMASISDVQDVGSSTESMLIAANVAKEPFRDFMIRHSSVEDRMFFVNSLQKLAPPGQPSGVGVNDLVVVIPAFTISELTSAFQIGFLIFLPFIIIDLVVSNILMAMGMMMLSPTIVSLPFKLLLFVLVEGWAKLAHGLVMSYL